MDAAGQAHIVKTHSVLVALSRLEDERLLRDFCGSVITAGDLSQQDLSQKTVYLCGDISRSSGLDLKAADRVLVIGELSHGYDEGAGRWALVEVGRVPVLVHGVGVYYRRFFEQGLDYFNRICAEHVFQSLTESTKPGRAHRTGIYLTPVERDGESLHFRLLRCSTNLSGPTENFRANDRHIVGALNLEAAHIFRGQAPLNHVLAQIYHNTPATDARKQTKARIKTHADKTKDMPRNGVMAFCTFYDQLGELQPLAGDAFDHGAGRTSGLTKLIFRLKEPDAERSIGDLPERFTVTLYPDSVFFMPLSTNRLYTHEIRPPMLDAAKLPTRMGYVVRCSTTEAVHEGGHTFIKRRGELKRLEPPTPEGMGDLRRLYAEENKTGAVIDYGDRFLFSMNKGDYAAPRYDMADEFRQYSLHTEADLFRELLASVRFESVTRGRRGTVLGEPDEVRGTPIVRTTTRYHAPAQGFRSVHRRLARLIEARASLPVGFNNALIEHYTNAYASMGAHSDQALDLKERSAIAVFSCYQYPELATPPRKLVVESKEPGGGTFEVALTHNSVVVFSTGTNRRFKHKIVLDRSSNPPDNQWLGVTFRTSRTFVRFREDRPFLEDGTPLTLADDDQRREFYRLRRLENQEVDFTCPRMTFTISASDLMPPAGSSDRRG